ncbi:hypothetical protein V494_03857 [Pseudogymnoascus sp. VKM F-4513 (FW-928)]|nr:hypothetical protein V494_03857 [Pseudogymnoascus sp. VKM F-4513 (FW-928)]
MVAFWCGIFGLARLGRSTTPDYLKLDPPASLNGCAARAVDRHEAISRRSGQLNRRSRRMRHLLGDQQGTTAVSHRCLSNMWNGMTLGSRQDRRDLGQRICAPKGTESPRHAVARRAERGWSPGTGGKVSWRVQVPDE